MWATLMYGLMNLVIFEGIFVCLLLFIISCFSAVINYKRSIIHA
jgi:hypothetical protein